jgi:ABC-type antimicrobial peptide transport system ATPase subunit
MYILMLWGNFMDLIFDDIAYSRFFSEKRTIYNPRLRGDNETFLDAMLSKEADLRTTPEREKIIQFIQSIGNE